MFLLDRCPTVCMDTVFGLDWRFGKNKVRHRPTEHFREKWTVTTMGDISPLYQVIPKSPLSNIVVPIGNSQRCNIAMEVGIVCWCLKVH